MWEGQQVSPAQGDALRVAAYVGAAEDDVRPAKAVLVRLVPEQVIPGRGGQGGRGLRGYLL